MSQQSPEQRLLDRMRAIGPLAVAYSGAWTPPSSSPRPYELWVRTGCSPSPPCRRASPTANSTAHAFSPTDWESPI